VLLSATETSAIEISVIADISTDANACQVERSALPDQKQKCEGENKVIEVLILR
jgi:hypothetical protein